MLIGPVLFSPLENKSFRVFGLTELKSCLTRLTGLVWLDVAALRWPWSRVLTAAQRANSFGEKTKQKKTSISPPAANSTCGVFHAAVAAKTQITRQPGTFKAACASGLHTSKLAILSSSFTALSVKRLFCFSILFIVSALCFLLAAFVFKGDSYPAIDLTFLKHKDIRFLAY